MPNIELALKWYYDRISKVYYSMDYRNGQQINSAGQLVNSGGRPGFDCSSALYYALIQGGYLSAGTWIGNTDSLYRDLEKNGWEQVKPDGNGYIATQRGDLGLWGKRGVSGGGAGHAMAWVNPDDIIHCSYGYNGIAVSNHDWLSALNGYPELTVYRYTGASLPAPTNAVDQIIEIGSLIKFDKAFRADDVQLIGDVWQVQSNELCQANFTWDDNGIPSTPLIEVDNDGFATPDQELEVGSTYKLPGKFSVQDVGQDGDRWLALIESNGLKFWVDIETATEVSASDSGTSTPSLRPPVTTPTPIVDVTPVPTKTPEPTPNPTLPVPVDEPKPEPKPPVINIPKEEVMAFTKEQRDQLAVATKDAMVTIDKVGEGAEVQEIVNNIPKNVKVAVYLVGDSLLGASALTPQVMVFLHTADPFVQASALSSTLATAGLFLLTMFGIYKNGQGK
jgi:hypothetical protein